MGFFVFVFFFFFFVVVVVGVGVGVLHFLELSSFINLKKSCGVEFVALIIFAILLVDGQRGCSYFENLLLLLKVVGSRPLHFAKPEQDILCSLANMSIACQICS